MRQNCADYLKISKIEKPDDIRKLQADLNTVIEWCQVWLMELNTENCKVMKIGRNKTVGWERNFTLPNKEENQVQLMETKNAA